MAFQLQLQEEPDCSLWVHGQSTDYLRALIDHSDYSTEYDLRRMVPDIAGNVLLMPGLVGESLLVDTQLQVAYLVRNGFVKLIAGTYGFRGFRDGAGNQALLGAGALQDVTYGVGRNSSGHWFFTDGKNNKIRKLVEQPDGSWIVSTFCNTSFPNSLAVDASDNVWTVDSNQLKKFNSAGTLASSFSLPTSNIIQIIILGNNKILWVTRNNAWDFIGTTDMTTGANVRIAGMDDAEVAAFAQTNGFNLVDGPALNGATFHSVGLSYANSDASIVLTSGGDERQVRKIEGGRVSSLLNDGTYAEVQTRVQQASTNPALPFFIVSAGGIRDLIFPTYSFPFGFIPQGGLSWVKKIVAVDIGDPGLTNASQFISVSVPSPMIAGQQYSATVVFKNTGTSTWRASTNHNLGSSNQRDNTTFNFPAGNANRVTLSGDVAPNANATFTFPIRAPATPGTYVFGAEMVQDGVEWFGQVSTPVVVTVDPMPSTTLIPVTISMKY
jgi:hypothetical protein